MTRLLALLALLGALIFGPAAPANAGDGWPGGHVEHAADDSGFNDPILVTGSYGSPWSTARWLGLGASSKWYYRDADGIYVGAGRDVACRYRGTHLILFRFTSTGWHKITDIESYVCYHQLD